MDNDYFSASNPNNYWAREADIKAQKAQADAEDARNAAAKASVPPPGVKSRG